MSDNLKPWLRRYTLEHAQTYGLELEQCKPLTRVCQLIHFRTYEIGDDPYGPPGGLWADISDGQWHVPVHIPAQSVEEVVRAHGPMTKLTGGLFSVTPTGFMFQCLPTTRTAIERDPRLAMRVNVKSYVGSAGENIFKDPRAIMNDAAVSTWVRALGGDNEARHKFSDAATAALLEEQQRRAMQPTRKPSRTGSTVLAGMVPRERNHNAPQHAKSNSGTGVNVKERENESSKKTTQRTAKDKALAEYRALWGKRSLKMKWYLIPDDQRVILDKIDFPTDEEAIMRALAPSELPPSQTPLPNRDVLDLRNTTSPTARLTALPSSPPIPAPSSLPTQTATSAAPSRAMSPELGPPEPMSPELGPPEDLDDKEDDDDDDDDDKAIEWSSSPAPQRQDDEHDKFAFATPRPPSQPVILVPNSDPSSRATNSQSQSQSIAHGSQSQSVAAGSQSSQPSQGNLVAPNGSQRKRQQHQPSSAAPTHVSDTVLHSSAPGPPAADGDESLTQSTSQSQPQPEPRPEDAPRPPAEGDQSLTQSTSQSQSQKDSEVQQRPEPIVEAATEPRESRPQGPGRPAEASPAAMEVDLPSPVAEKLDDDNASAYAFLVAAGDGAGSRARKRARVHEGSTSPAAKRARQSGESTEREAKPTSSRDPSLPPASQGATARARKTVAANGHAKRRKGLPDDAGPTAGADRARPGPVGPVQAKAAPVDNARAPVAPDVARPVKVESPSPVQRQKRSPEVQRPSGARDEQDPAQPPDITLQGVMDMLFRLGQARQREAADNAKASNPRR